MDGSEKRRGVDVKYMMDKTPATAVCHHLMRNPNEAASLKVELKYQIWDDVSGRNFADQPAISFNTINKFIYLFIMI